MSYIKPDAVATSQSPVWTNHTHEWPQTFSTLDNYYTKTQTDAKYTVEANLVTGSGTLANATTTEVTVTGASATSEVFVCAKSAACAAIFCDDGVGFYVTPGTNKFTITHPTAAGTETFMYFVKL